jgi:hypothetical protein
MDEIKNQQKPKTKINILDTTYFIKLKPLDLVNNWKYYTSDFITKEIRDEKVFYNFSLCYTINLNIVTICKIFCIILFHYKIRQENSMN